MVYCLPVELTCWGLSYLLVSGQIVVRNSPESIRLARDLEEVCLCDRGFTVYRTLPYVDLLEAALERRKKSDDSENSDSSRHVDTVGSEFM